MQGVKGNSTVYIGVYTAGFSSQSPRDTQGGNTVESLARGEGQKAFLTVPVDTGTARTGRTGTTCPETQLAAVFKKH